MRRAEEAVNAWLTKDIQKAMTIVNAEKADNEITPPV